MSPESRKVNFRANKRDLYPGITMPSILICNESITSGGLGTYTLTLADGLRERGWLIHFLVTNGPNEYYSDMKKIAFRCHDLSSLPLSYKKLKVAAGIVNATAPDILLLNHCSLLHHSLPYISTKIKPVSILHNDIQGIYNVARRYYKRIFRWIAPSQALAKHFRPYVDKNIQNRIKVIQHGVNADLFSLNGRDAILKSPRISFVGNLDMNKGSDMLPLILEHVTQRFPNVEITITGKGPLRSLLEKRLSEKNIKAAFTGYITAAQVAKILNDTEILLLPSRVEGFGLIIVEAMLCGAVPVVSRLPGITDDIIEDGVTGTLVQSGDVEGFADAVVSLLKNPERLVLMSEAAREYAVHRYPAERMLDAYEALFNEDDDRERMLLRGTMGWIMEMISEVIRKGVDRQWLFNRAKEIWKQAQCGNKS